MPAYDIGLHFKKKIKKIKILNSTLKPGDPGHKHAILWAGRSYELMKFTFYIYVGCEFYWQTHPALWINDHNCSMSRDFGR